jgi:hypothetical protein
VSKTVEQPVALSKFVELCRKAAQTIGAMEKGDGYTKAEQQWITETKDRLAQRRGKKPATEAGQPRPVASDPGCQSRRAKPGHDPFSGSRKKPGSLSLSKA